MREGKRCILVVEDEQRLRRVLRDFFKIKQFSILEAGDGEEAVEMYYDYNAEIDLVILDLMLPKLSGEEVIKEIRKKSHVPVLVLTAKNTEQDQVSLFQKGADDYLVKPFSNQILLAHVEAILKRGKSISPEVEQIGMLEIHRDSRVVMVGGHDLMLTSKEFEMLLYFIDNRHMSIHRETILDNVWGFSYDGDQRTVDTHIKQLRSKLPEKCNYIKTVYGYGYRFEETDEEHEE